MKNLRKADGRLLHRFRAGEGAIEATIDDYTFLIWGLIELYEATFDARYIDHAVQLNNELLGHFWDSKDGGLYFTPDFGEELLVRQKEIYDGALPSGNAVAFLNLLRLTKLTNDPELAAKASHLSRAFSGIIERNPSVHTQFLIGLDYALGPSYEVLLEGPPEAKKTKDMIKALRMHFLPNTIVHLNSKLKPTNDLFLLSDPKKQQNNQETETMVYVCVNYSCQKPTSDVNEMLKQLGVKT